MVAIELATCRSGRTGGDGPIAASLTSGSDTAAHPERDNAVDRLKPDETGSLNFEVPITVPPGRNKVTTPGLALEYTSKPSSDVSPLGYGWSINIPYIERLNKNGTDQIYSRHEFSSTMDGELYGATTTYIVINVNVTFDNSAINLGSDSSFTVGNSSNRMLLVSVVSNGSTAVTAVSYGGQAMTKMDSNTYATGSENGTQSTWYLVARLAV